MTIWVALMALPLTGYVVLTPGGRSFMAAAAAEMVDATRLLAKRSPGARADGALAQSKLRRAIVPHERVLSTVRSRPGAGTTPSFVDPGDPGAPGFDPGAVPQADNRVIDNVVGPGLGSVIVPGGIVTTPSTGGGGTGGGGTGGTNPDPQNPNPQNPDPQNPIPPAGVPEPATWIAMLMGLFAIGVALRRRRGAFKVARARGR